jgi:T5orf172 domain
MKTPFAPTKSFCYKVARYELLDQIAQEPEALSGLPFKMIEVTKRVIERNLSPDQLSIEISAEQASRIDTVFGSIKFFVQLHAKRLANSPFIWLGQGGMFKLKADADIAQEIEEAELEGIDDEGDEIEFDGWIYAFSFPTLVKANDAFPIKIGLTEHDVQKRVDYQCKGSASFDNPIILGSWQVNRVKAIESTIHSLLKSRGKWRENVPGTEWFDTTLPEIESIIQFIQQK